MVRKKCATVEAKHGTGPDIAAESARNLLENSIEFGPNYEIPAKTDAQQCPTTARNIPDFGKESSHASPALSMKLFLLP